MDRDRNTTGYSERSWVTKLVVAATESGINLSGVLMATKKQNLIDNCETVEIHLT